MDVRKMVLKETGIIAIGEAIGVAGMFGVFVLLGRFDLAVLIGGLVGGLAAILNFFVMALSVNIAADKAVAQNVAGGQRTMKSSYMLRMVLLFLILFAFAKSGVADPFALVIPLVFVRFTITLAEFFRRKEGENKV